MMRKWKMAYPATTVHRPAEENVGVQLRPKNIRQQGAAAPILQ